MPDQDNSERSQPEADLHLLPLFLNLKDRPIVIFGAGSVGERKAGLFSVYAPVKVFSRDFSEGLLKMSAEPGRRLDLVKCNLSLATTDLSQFLQGAFIAIPATNDSKINAAIEVAAGKMGILVNRVEGTGDVVVPSIIRRGTIAVAITTEIPGYTRFLRQHLEDALDQRHADMARLLARIRRENRQLVPEQKDRAAIIHRILEDEQVWRLLAVSYEKAYMRARSHAQLNERDCLDAGDP